MDSIEKSNYDYIVIGAGISGCAFARVAADRGKKVLIIERREEIGGACKDYKQDNYYVHLHGPHIFHTDKKYIWDFVNRFTKFNNFVNSPLAYINGQMYNLPFNMNTFYKVFGTYKPYEVNAIIEREKEEARNSCNNTPSNLQEQACCLVGKTIYSMFIKDYTEKQWGKPCEELDPNIIKRLPIRLSYNNNYFNDRYQGIPIEGYLSMMMNMIHNEYIDVITNYSINDLSDICKHLSSKGKIIYTGSIDELMNYEYGTLEWRTCRFNTLTLKESNYQGNAVVNYMKEPYTRIIEHKHFTCLNNDSIYNVPNTVITYEYPEKWILGKERYYPINDNKNIKLYNYYTKLLEDKYPIKFLGRLGQYKYMNMDTCIDCAFILYDELKYV